MAIVDNKGNAIDVDNLDDVNVEAGADTSYVQPEFNDGKSLGGEVGEDGKIIEPTPTPEVDEDGNPILVEKPEDPKPGTSFEKPGEDDLTDGDVPQPNQEQSDFYKGLGSILEDKGLLKMGETPFTDEEGFIKAYETEINARLSDRNKTIEEYMNAGVPYSVVNKIEAAINNTAGITEDAIREDPDLGKNLILSEFNNRGFDETTANRYYDMFKESGKDVEEAMNALNLRKATLGNMLQEEIDKAKTSKATAAKAEDQLAVDLVKEIETGKVLDRNITKSTQGKLLKTLNTVVGYTQNGQPLNALMKFKLENPVQFEKNLLYLYTVTEGFSNLKSLDRSAESRVSRQFQNAVTNISSGKSFTEKSSTPNKTLIDIDSIDDIV